MQAAPPLQQLVEVIESSGMRAPLKFLLDMLSPLDVVSSQLACFSRPFLIGTRVEMFVAALSEPAAWTELRRLLDQKL